MGKEYLELPFEIKAEDVQENGTFKGYASTFGGKPDSYGDIIVQGAFSDTLAKGGRNGYGVSMLWQHDPKMVPGVWTSLNENNKGLPVEGKLAIGTQLGADARELMKLGAIKGLSIGYDIPKGGAEFDDKKKVRYLKRVNLWEISLVTFPANTRAQITNVKSLLEASTEREFEAALRDSGLSKQAALYVVSLCKSSLRDSKMKQASIDKVMSALKMVNADLSVYNMMNG